MKRKKINNIIVLFSIFICSFVDAQMSFLQDIYTGGVTCAGYSPDYFQTAPVTGVITVNIAAGSTIRKAYLFCGRLGVAPAANCTLNGSPIVFTATNQVSPTFNTIYGGNSAVHAIDVTALVSVGVNVYNLGLPAQSSTSNRYQDFYLYISYNNGAMTQVATAIFLNTQSAAFTMNWGTLTLTNPINTAGDAVYSFFGGYECSVGDGEQLILNGTNLGVAVGQDINSGQCGGPVGSFYMNNNVAAALSDDNLNQTVTGPEVLSKFNAITINGATSVTLNHVHNGGGGDNHPWGGFFAYKPPSTLPVELSSYTIKCDRNKAMINWTTATETNNDHFSIERSENGVDFTEIGTVRGGGNSNQNRYYVFTDDKPLQKLSYYRIRQVDVNGKGTASNPMVYQWCDDPSFVTPKVYPNPAQDYLNINFETTPQNASYSLRKASGEEIYSGNLEELVNVINIENYTPGFYILKISNNGNFFTSKFIKK